MSLMQAVLWPFVILGVLSACVLVHMFMEDLAFRRTKREERRRAKKPTPPDDPWSTR